MKVKELIEELQKFPQEKEVVIDNVGDRKHLGQIHICEHEEIYSLCPYIEGNETKIIISRK